MAALRGRDSTLDCIGAGTTVGRPPRFRLRGSPDSAEADVGIGASVDSIWASAQLPSPESRKCLRSKELGWLGGRDSNSEVGGSATVDGAALLVARASFTVGYPSPIRSLPSTSVRRNQPPPWRHCGDGAVSIQVGGAWRFRVSHSDRPCRPRREVAGTFEHLRLRDCMPNADAPPHPRLRPPPPGDSAIGVAPKRGAFPERVLV